MLEPDRVRQTLEQPSKCQSQEERGRSLRNFANALVREGEADLRETQQMPELGRLR